jgi:acyl-coenzyme A synthetase/AMP-(fatty) acid ligase
VAFVVLTDDPLGGESDLLEALRALARSSLADYKAPDRLVVTDSLPLTSMMKVDKRSLADRADRAAQAARQAPTRPGDGRARPVPADPGQPANGVTAR